MADLHKLLLLALPLLILSVGFVGYLQRRRR
jgi:hypothetical protein